MKLTVTVVGAAGGIGQPLSLLLKQNPTITQLNLFDVAPTVGIATDLSHINTPATVTPFSGEGQMKQALTGANVVVCVAGVTIKPGQTRDDVFPINAGIIRKLAIAIADTCPNALVAVVSNPVNSLVPLIVEVMRMKNVSGAERRIFGVTTLDVIRANTFVAEAKGLDVSTVSVPVIGGHAGITIIPVLSQAKPHVQLTSHEERDFHTKVQEAANKVLAAKEGKGTATLSMAHAAAKFAASLICALTVHEQVECTYVKLDPVLSGSCLSELQTIIRKGRGSKSHIVTSVSYFSTRIRIGKQGIQENLGLGVLSPDEVSRVAACLPDLQDSIRKGEEAAHV